MGEVIEHEHISQMHLRHYLGGGCLLLILACVTYYSLIFFDLDPLWSVSLAKKYCINPDWVHLDTSLFFAMDRDISCIIGKIKFVIAATIFVD